MNHTQEDFPVKVFLFSGKRKSGKDYIADVLQSKIGKNKCIILRLSAPLKKQYAKENNLYLERLLDASAYKETYRQDMIKWGEEKRNREPGYFCGLVVEQGHDFPVWIISDARRRTDVEYFKERFGERVMTVRIEASEEVRCERGWVFTPGVDDVESECGLDSGVEFDVVIENNGARSELESALNRLYTELL